jgi:hypothetical protein
LLNWPRKIAFTEPEGSFTHTPGPSGIKIGDYKSRAIYRQNFIPKLQDETPLSMIVICLDPRTCHNNNVLKQLTFVKKKEEILQFFTHAALQCQLSTARGSNI